MAFVKKKTLSNVCLKSFFLSFVFFGASNFFHKLLFPLFLGKMSVCARANIADMANKKVIACNRDIIFTVRVI